MPSPLVSTLENASPTYSLSNYNSYPNTNTPLLNNILFRREAYSTIVNFSAKNTKNASVFFIEIACQNPDILARARISYKDRKFTINVFVLLNSHYQPTTARLVQSLLSSIHQSHADSIFHTISSIRFRVSGHLDRGCLCLGTVHSHFFHAFRNDQMAEHEFAPLTLTLHFPIFISHNHSRLKRL